MAMELKHLNPQHVMDVTGKAIDEISRLRTENAEAVIALKDREKEIMELNERLESEKASHYAEMVDAGMENRRLKRALYKACANWAHFAVAFFSSYATKDRWYKMEQKCQAKAEKYK